MLKKLKRESTSDKRPWDKVLGVKRITTWQSHVSPAHPIIQYSWGLSPCARVCLNLWHYLPDGNSLSTVWRADWARLTSILVTGPLCFSLRQSEPLFPSAMHESMSFSSVCQHWMQLNTYNLSFNYNDLLSVTGPATQYFTLNFMMISLHWTNRLETQPH